MDLSRLKRFDKAKHEQLEGLLQWCQLMGLSGRDLVSLGGHIDRLQVRSEIEQNRRIVESIHLDKVGKDIRPEERWTIKTASGRYLFELEYGDYRDAVYVTSYKTKLKKKFRLYTHYNLGKMHWRKRKKYEVLLEYHHGRILLDF